MSCGCTSTKKTRTCGCSSSCGCDPVCPSIATSLEVTNAFNIPACGERATLYIPCLTVALIGGWISNPTYGMFEIVAFNSVNGQLTIENTCLPGNEAPGTVVPAGTSFVFSGPPAQTVYETWSPTLSASGAMTVTAQVIHQAEYYIQDSTFNFTFAAGYTLGGTANIVIYIPLPAAVTGIPDNILTGLICAAHQNGTVVAGGARWRCDTVDPTRLIVFLHAAANWTLGADAGVAIQGRIKIVT